MWRFKGSFTFVFGWGSICSILLVLIGHVSSLTAAAVPGNVQRQTVEDSKVLRIIASDTATPTPSGNDVGIFQAEFSICGSTDIVSVAAECDPVAQATGMPPFQAQNNEVFNPAKTIRAFIFRAEDKESVYYEILSSHQVFEVTDTTDPVRPISNIRWLSNTLLVFDRWSQPHYGWRYLVNTQTGEVHFANLVDYFWIISQAEPSTTRATLQATISR